MELRRSVISSGVEKSPGEEFPVGMKHKGVMSSGKPFANSFLSVRNTMVPCRIGNHSRGVSCRGDTPWSHVEWETIRKQFPVGMKHKGAMSSGKLFANSFLSVKNTKVSCRVGNYSQTVSCRYETQRRHIEWETIRKQFPVGMKHKGVMSSGKPFANSFLSVRNIMVPRRIGNYWRLRKTWLMRYI